MFNFFRKKKTDEISNPSIKIEKTKDGKVGDFWSCYLGFEVQSSKNYARELTACTMEYGKKIHSDASISVLQLEGNYSAIFSFAKEDTIISAYPILKSNKSIPFQTVKIIEWEHVNNLEAQIEGRGEAKFGLSFFANDYVINRKKYRENQDLNIVFTGFAINAEKFQPEKGFSDEFVAYMPNSEYGKYSVIDFVGEVKNVTIIKETHYGIEIEGYWMTLILVRSKEENVYFELDVFLNKQNTELTSINIGDKLTGMIKLSGKIE